MVMNREGLTFKDSTFFAISIPDEYEGKPCKDLKGVETGKMVRSCPGCIEDAATILADILKKFAKPEYLIGRVDGDVFNVVIPIPEEDEAEGYMENIQKACMEYEDLRLAPSVAVGIAMRNNVEETMEQVFSDAEYEMFENKMMLKQAEGYQERLRKGL